MQLISKYNKGFRFLLYVIDIYSKYAWVVPSNDKKGITITNAFQKIFDELNLKPNKIWINKGSKFYDRSMKSWLYDNDATHKEGTFVVAERFIKTSKNEIYKYTTSASKNVYTNKLDDIVNKYNSTYHSTIKMNPVNVNSSTHINFGIKVIEKKSTFEY